MDGMEGDYNTEVLVQNSKMEIVPGLRKAYEVLSPLAFSSPLERRLTVSGRLSEPHMSRKLWRGLHMLRHSCGYALANKGYDTRLIQDYLGHKNIQHTGRYTRTASRRFEGLVGLSIRAPLAALRASSPVMRLCPRGRV